MKTTHEQLGKRVFLEFLKAYGPFLIPIGYVEGLLVGVTRETLAQALGVGLLHLVVFAGVVPSLIIRQRVQKLGAQSQETRLVALLALPRRVDLSGGASLIAGAVLYVFVARALFGTGSFTTALLVALIVSSLIMLAGIRFTLATEQMLRKDAVAEFHADPGARPTGYWGHWPRMRWYLPFAFLSILVGTASLLGIFTYSRVSPAVRSIEELLLREGHPEAAELVVLQAGRAGADIVLPLVLLCGFMLFFSYLTATQLARRYGDASREVQRTIEAFAEGSPRLPRWIGTDEFGDLAVGLAGVFERLAAHASTLRTSATELIEAAIKLGATTTQQNAMMSRHAAALRETEVTAQEIKQTSMVASEKTSSVLKTSERAVELGRTGGQAIEQSLAGLSGIRDEVSEMSEHIVRLGERAQQIETITRTVKDLADQSNMLALNAAIEAVRSGEHGKGFSVVAREIRTLADQSIQATTRVRDILNDITSAIAQTVELSERGTSRVQRSLVQVESSGSSLREVSAIVSENAQTTRIIAGAVNQQGAGISQIFVAVKDLALVMDTTVEQLQQTEATIGVVRAIAERVEGAVKGFAGAGAATDEPEERAA